MTYCPEHGWIPYNKPDCDQCYNEIANILSKRAKPTARPCRIKGCTKHALESDSYYYCATHKKRASETTYDSHGFGGIV